MIREKDLLDGVATFLAVAQAGSFTKAARKLGVSTSAASQAVRNLEARLNVGLLTRSTRSLRLTDAGTSYVGRVGPALAAIAEATREVMVGSSEPVGPLRLTMPRSAYAAVVGPSLWAFRQAHPSIQVEVEIEGKLVDIVENGFDAGFRYGNFLANGMTAVRVHGSTNSGLVAAPTYLAQHPKPTRPTALGRHDSVVCRNRTTGALTPWLLTSRGRSVKFVPASPTIANDLATQIDLTVDGLGISATPLHCVAEHIEAGKLIRLLPAWAIAHAPIYLYYPTRPQQPPALRALITYLRQRALFAPTGVVAAPSP